MAPSSLTVFSLAACAAALSCVFVHHSTRLENATGATPGSGKMFDAIAPHYDALNRVMSLGQDMHWRRELLQELHLRGGETIYDLATGTADVAIMLAEAPSPPASVVGVDPSAEMLQRGRAKVAQRQLDATVRLDLGDATSLAQYPSLSADAVTMSFGIRNVLAAQRADVVAEAFRLLKPLPTSRLAIMEFAEPRHGVMGALAKLFVSYVVPLIGYLGSGDAAAYQHLQRSIADFPSPEAFATLIAGPDERRGYAFDVQRKELMWGVVQIYVARPLAAAPTAVPEADDAGEVERSQAPERPAVVAEPEAAEEGGEPVDLQLAPEGVEEVPREEAGKPELDVFAEVRRLEALATTVYTAATPGDMAGKEGSHVPVVERAERVLTVKVPHGMSDEHLITFLYLKNEEGQVVAAKAFRGDDDAADLAYEAWGAGAVTPFALCNQHGLWKGDTLAL